MPLAGGGLVHAEAFEGFPIALFPCLIHTAADEVPDAILAYFGLFANLGDGQDFCHGEKESLHEESEAAVGLCPWDGGGFHLSGRSLDARHARPDGGAVLEETQVLPAALNGVVNGAKCGGLGAVFGGGI